MTKKDYELIAHAIKRQWNNTVQFFGKGDESMQVHNTAMSIAYTLESANPRFDRNKFLTACGIED